MSPVSRPVEARPITPSELPCGPSDARSRLYKLARHLLPLATLAIFILAAWMLNRAIAEIHFASLKRYLLSLSTGRVAAALAFTFASYVVLVGYDLLALQYVHKRISLAATALASFVSYAFTNNVGAGGFGALTGASVRFRLYATAGLNGFEITAVIAFCLATFFVGAMLCGGVALILHPEVLAVLEHISPTAIRGAGLGMIFLVVGYLILSMVRRRSINVGKWSIRIPRFQLAVGQVALSSIDILLAGAALYQLMPNSLPLGFPAFLAAYVLALIVGVISHVPGGLGVFESVVVMLLRDAPTPKVLGALLLYRLVYYLLPLIIATILFAVSEFYARRQNIASVARAVTGPLAQFAPQISAVAVFLSGLVLLISGATPALEDRLNHLKTFLPLPILEISHMTGSIAGIGLLLLSRSLLRRLDAAYLLTVTLLIVGAVASLLKGIDYEEAAFLVCMALVLAPARRAFYRHSVLIGRFFSVEWVFAILVIVAGTTWLGSISYRNAEYAGDLWWQFAFASDVSRFMRASVVVALIAIIYGARQLLRPIPPIPLPPGPDEREKLLPLVASSRDTRASLVLLGDKSVLLSERADGFLMYGVRGRSWVAMGDPLGPPEARAELAWRFRELCDQHAGYPAFYQVGTENIPLYIELGLALFKLGDEARVDLAQFSLEKPGFKDLRYSNRRTSREGATFEVIPPSDVQTLMPELRRVSEEWLAERKYTEKGFSVGAFDERYLINFHCAVVRVDNKIVAFSNLWLGADKHEFSIDLMRYRPHQLYGVMDFLFVELIRWGQVQGYKWFNLGVAPLSGLEAHHLAPVWYHAGSMLYRFGDQFYSFRGLRKYKEKFCPEWRPKFLACPSGLALGRVLLDVTSLISRVSPGLSRG